MAAECRGLDRARAGLAYLLAGARDRHPAWSTGRVRCNIDRGVSVGRRPCCSIRRDPPSASRLVADRFACRQATPFSRSTSTMTFGVCDEIYMGRWAKRSPPDATLGTAPADLAQIDAALADRPRDAEAGGAGDLHLLSQRTGSDHHDSPASGPASFRPDSVQNPGSHQLEQHHETVGLACDHLNPVMPMTHHPRPAAVGACYSTGAFVQVTLLNPASLVPVSARLKGAGLTPGDLPTGPTAPP